VALTDRVLFLVPARGGSERIPGKNLRHVAGIPLVGHAVRAARLAAAGLEDAASLVVCSTDDAEIAAAALAWGADDVLDRPPALATSTASSIDVAIQALDTIEGRGAPVQALVLVQPTSPLTHPDDLRGAVERFRGLDGRGVVSVTDTHPAAWHQGLAAGSDELAPVEAEDSDHVLTGAFYIADAARLRASRTFLERGTTVGAAVRPERSVDVDEPEDLVLAEALADARPVPPLSIGTARIGDGRTWVIAEAGVNHNGDVGLAHRLVDAAAETGADAVKFQTFEPDALAAMGAPVAEYQRAEGTARGDQRDMLARLALPAEAWEALQQHATDRGLVFLSTPFDDTSADLLARLGVPAFKVGSGELTNVPFLVRLAGHGRPMLISTGMAEMHEVAQAVDAIRATGNLDLALFHCVSSYPAAPADANLRAIVTLRRAFSVPTGWSDHTPGIELPVAATALGASLIEKHMTLDRGMAGPDHATSLEPGEFARMVEAIRTTAAALGSGIKRPAASEAAIAAVARRSLHWRRSLAVGAGVEADDLVALRPGTGISPARVPTLVGRRLARGVSAGAMVVPGDLEPPA
jgi:sialic acid synthase SpsE/CMP-N-acetylneuraminic acid synthetase